MITVCDHYEECGCNAQAALYALHARLRDTVNPNMNDVLDLLSMVRLDIDRLPHVPYAPYWEFMENVVDNIQTGKWKMHPYMWYQYIMNADYIPLSSKEVSLRRDALRNKCINMLRERAIAQNSFSDKQVLLSWARNPNGIQDILSVAKTIVDLHQLFSKKGK